MAFAAAPEYEVWPRPGLTPYQAAVRAAHETVGADRAHGPEVVVADILTVAGGLAAQMAQRPWATLIPHVYPAPERGMAPYSSGARMPPHARSARPSGARSTARWCAGPSADGAS